MLAPSIPVDESRRLVALRRLRILDTPPEERFDRITRLAKRLFNVPTATITLVDDDRQWFKSSMGLSATQTPRDVSFCGHAINTTSIMVVPDARLDSRFHDNPFVTGDPHVRFYAGCPLTMPDGSTIGTLCVIDSQPREFGKDDRALLSDLTRMVEQELKSVQIAAIDDLTALPNRIAFKMLAQQALDRCCRLKQYAMMIYFDFNGIKEINNVHGHAEGDRALKLVALILQETLSDDDISGRVDGSEFAVLVSDCSNAQANEIIESIRVRLAKEKQESMKNYDIGFSAVSVVAKCFEQQSIAQLFADADMQMYARKRADSNARFKIK